jgi:hypothetical protein
MEKTPDGDDLKRFEMTTPLHLVPLIESRRRQRLKEARFPSRVLRDRPNVRLQRELLDTVRTEVQSDPDLKLQDVFEDALMLWLRVREYDAAGMALIPTPVQLNTLSI